MDTRTGEIYDPESLKKMRQALEGLQPDSNQAVELREKLSNLREMVIEPTPAQMSRRPLPRVGRNDPCPCNSGKKFKKCCLSG